MIAAARLNSAMAILHIQSVETLDLPELKIYLTLRRVEEHERAGVLVAANNKIKTQDTEHSIIILRKELGKSI